MNYLREVTTSFELELDSRIEFSVIGSDSSVNPDPFKIRNG